MLTNVPQLKYPTLFVDSIKIFFNSQKELLEPCRIVVTYLSQISISFAFNFITFLFSPIFKSSRLCCALLKINKFNLLKVQLGNYRAQRRFETVACLIS